MNINDQILVLNSGSTSLKYKLYGFKLTELKAGYIEEIGRKGPKNHKEALEKVLKDIGNTENIKQVGHRVVHGGNIFNKSTVVDDKTVAEISKFNRLAPLHNPANLQGIEASLDLVKGAMNIAVFDTAFYRDMPDYAYLYAIPKEFSEKYGIRRYGFHGISHNYVLLEAARKLKKTPDQLNMISCHLGGGASVTAIKEGKAVDTSMGFTPMEGLPMASRCGDLDPGIVIELVKNKDIEINKYTSGERISDVDYILNCESGLKGLSGAKTDSIYDIATAAENGDEKMMNVLKFYTYRIRKYIGAYKAVLGNLDAVAFTGTVGFRNETIRKMITGDFEDIKAVKKLVIQTDEELMIAREVLAISG